MHRLADLLELVVQIVRRPKRLPIDDQRRADNDKRSAASSTFDGLID